MAELSEKEQYAIIEKLDKVIRPYFDASTVETGKQADGFKLYLNNIACSPGRTFEEHCAYLNGIISGIKVALQAQLLVSDRQFRAFRKSIPANWYEY